MKKEVKKKDLPKVKKEVKQKIKNEKKTKFKNIIGNLPLIFIGLATILVIVLIIFTVVNKNKLEVEKNNKPKIADNIKFKKEYENLNGKTNDNKKEYPEVEISEDNIIQYTNYEEINDIIDNKKSAVVYFGFAKCPWCRNAVPVLLQAASTTALDKILYLDIYEDRNILKNENGQIITEKEGTKEYNELVEKLKEKLDVYEGLNNDSIKRIYAPTVMFIKDGEVLSIHTSTVESQIDPYITLNKEQRKELFEIYQKGILSTLDSDCNNSTIC